MIDNTKHLPSVRKADNCSYFVEFGGASRQGTAHERNQDSLAFAANGLAFALFDGMGGAPFGEVVSRVGANVAVGTYEKGLTVHASMMASRKAVETVCTWLHSETSGCTALMAAAEGDRLRIEWLGDTVAILVRDNTATYLTVPDRVEGSKNIITGCFGGGIKKEIHACSIPIREGDVVLLCSDGVWSFVGEDAIVAACESNKPSPAIAGDLAYKVAKDSPDDASAIVLRFLLPTAKTNDIVAIDKTNKPVEIGDFHGIE